MARFIGGVFVALLVSVSGSPIRAADAKDANAVLDKAIKALGGQEKLSNIKAASWKGKGKLTFNDNDNDFTTHATVQGLDHFRSEFEGDFGGNQVKGVTVLAGDKGWRKFGDNKMEMDKDAVANEKRTVYLQVIPMTIVPLKQKEFKTELAGEEKVGDKPAVGVKVTGPEGKDFTLYFDKESGLPVKMVAKVRGFQGEEFTQETTFTDYKEMDGIKKATKIENKRDGAKFMAVQLTEFKIHDKVDAKEFAEPQ
jgi:hypothetical protein